MGVPVYGFSGYSGAGKTTLIEKLVASLKAKGLRTAVVKHDRHDFEVDRPGKDSWRFTRAGADISLITSETKSALVEQRALSLPQALSRIRDVDLILVEGWKFENFPQIGLCRKAAGKGFPKAVGAYAAVVTDREDIPPGIPRFSFDDIEGLTAFLLEQKPDFTRFHAREQAKMADAGEKPPARRPAAAARVLVNGGTLRLLRTGSMKKGDGLTLAQIAGIMGAGRAPDAIPMCRPGLSEGVELAITLSEERKSVEIVAAASRGGSAGAEMEVLSAASAAALAVYDMCRAVQDGLVITDVRLLGRAGSA